MNSCDFYDSEFLQQWFSTGATLYILLRSFEKLHSQAAPQMSVKSDSPQSESCPLQYFLSSLGDSNMQARLRTQLD